MYVQPIVLITLVSLQVVIKTDNWSPLIPCHFSPQDVPVTEEETKKLADTVDIDDMDASLFGSFSRGKKAEGRPPRSRSSAAKSAPEGKKMEKSGLLQETPPEGTEPLRPSVVTETTVGVPPVPPGGRRREASGDGDGGVGKSQNAGRSGNISLKEEKTKGLKSGTVFRLTRAMC